MFTDIPAAEPRQVVASYATYAEAQQAFEAASVVGVGLVAVFMIIAYGLLGVFAVIALLCNAFMMIGVLSGMHATLTLPGIAGILLTMGMAVDYNVLIFERIREEKKAGRRKDPRRASHYWFEQDTPFGNVEITFRARGDAHAPVRIYRHVVANLDDPHMNVDDRVLVHLRGRVERLRRISRRHHGQLRRRDERLHRHLLLPVGRTDLLRGRRRGPLRR